MGYLQQRRDVLIFFFFHFFERMKQFVVDLKQGVNTGDVFCCEKAIKKASGWLAFCDDIGLELSFQSGYATNDFGDFGGNGGLTSAVVLQSQGF